VADSSVTITGLDEMRRAVDQLPATVTAALKTVAKRSAQRIEGDAARRLRSQQKTEAHALADAITITEDVPNKQYIVTSKAPVGQPANLPIWNEHGTSKMAARPYMRPAADAEGPVYEREVVAAATDAVSEALS